MTILDITAGDSIVRGLVFGRIGRRFLATFAPIDLIGGEGNVVEGNFIGTDPTGTVARPNVIGVRIKDSSDNVIGGTTPAARNIISGNDGIGVEIGGGNSNRIQGNYIGIDRDGTAILPSGFGGSLGGVGVEVDCGVGNIIGGTAPGAGNLISGNGFGVEIKGSDNLVQGNFIGTDRDGTAALGNSVGIFVTDTANIIGGAEAGTGNLISGNLGNGIFINRFVFGFPAAFTTDTVVQGNRIGTDVDGIFSEADRSIIGGAEPGAGNLISGNGGHGVLIESRGFSPILSGQP